MELVSYLYISSPLHHIGSIEVFWLVDWLAGWLDGWMDNFHIIAILSWIQYAPISFLFIDKNLY